ncbi:Endochitinase, partial [Ooceraea biroi]
NDAAEIVDLRKSLREMHPPLQFVISIYDPATTLKTSAMVRQEAIARIIAAVKEVDGVEMNVTVGSKERLYNFVKSLKDEMIRKSYDKRILVALPSKPEDLAKQFNLKELAKYVDLFTLPTDYLTDKDGAFVTFHPSRLMGLFDMLNSDSMVDLISELGAPKRKILMTLPANAYKFTLKEETDNTPRSQTTEKDPTPIDRKELCEAINSGEWTVERDEDLTAPYAFQNKTWIAFEDKISVGIKGKYALLRDLAGLAVRNIESDMKTECERSLTQEIYHSFTEFKRKSRQAVLNALEDELHQTQFSYPTQAKTSSFRVVRVVDTEGHIRAVRENTQTEFVCRRQGYFVHPKSCNRFYRCVKFNQAVEDYSVFEFDCPAGLSFDERTEVCVWPGSLPQGSPCPGSSEIAPVAPKRFECSRPGYYADPGNCRWFFACMDLGGPELMAFEFRCPYGLVFDEKKLVCEWPWLVPACSESGSSYTRTEYDYGGHTAGISAGIGAGGYVTDGLPEYSATAGTGYSNTDYFKTTSSSTHGVSYFGGSTAEYIDEHAGISNFNGKTVSANVGFSGSAGVDYTGSTRGYGESVSSIPTYGSPGVHVGLVSPGTIVEEGRTGYTAGKTSTGHTISTGYSTGGIANTGSVGGIGSGYSGGQYSGTVSGSHLTNDGTIYSGTYRPSYTSSVAGGYTGSTSNPIAEGETYSKTSGTNYFGPTGLPGSTGVHISSLGPKYGEPTSLHTGFGATHAGGYSSTDVYSGTGHGTGISTFSGHGVTSADNGYFINGNIPPSGATGISSTGIRYENKEGYTVPVFVHQQPIYPSVGTTAVDVKGHTGTTSTSINVAGDYGRNDLARPNLNISIFGHEIPDYDVQKGSTGTILTGSSIEGSIHTGNSFSGTVFSHGNIPGAVSTPTISQGSILTGGAQPGYITTSSGTPGYVIRDGIKTVNVESGSSGTLIYGTLTPPISLTGPSTSGIVLKGDAIPSVVFSGQTAPGVSIGGSIQPGTIQSSTGKPYVSQPGSYYGISGSSADTKGSVTYSSSTLHGDLTPTTPHSYKADEEHDTLKFNTAYDINRYSENDIPDYRPTSAILPDSIVPAGYSSTKSSVFTPSGFTKTGPTRTGITTAILGGGGSYSVSTSERQPILNPDNISEKAFEGNVGYTKTSSGYYSSTLAPIARITPQSGTSGYSYPKPTIPFETGATFSSTPITPIKTYLPVTAPTPFLNVEVRYRGSSTPTSIIYTTEYPDTYKTTLFEAAKIPVSTVRPIIDTGYKTVIAPTNIPFSTLTDNGFTQRTGGLQGQTVTTSNIGLPFQRTDSNGQKDYSSFTSPSPSLGYLPPKSSQPDTIASTVKYDGPRVTVRPDIVGVTYKKPYEGPSSVISPTTFRPSSGYYAGQGFTTPSLVGTTPGGGSPTNLDISRDKIDKLITNYDRGTVKYTTNVYDNLASSRFGDVFAITTSTGPTTYEVTTKSPEGKGKVIVKWSDLHPLLLGKLGAECTCKADPFGTLRGPIRKLIDSSRGKVDLTNYDESNIYVDLEKDGSYEEGDYTNNYDDSQPYKISPHETTSVTTNSPNLPSSSYLPVSSTTVSTRGFVPAIATGISAKSDNFRGSSRFQVGFRAGKKLENISPSPNSYASYEEEEEDDPDQIIDGATNCARPGLFRHPGLCNKFYACYWDQWKKKFTLHIFNCPIHLTFDSNAGACNWPSKGPACQADNLVVWAVLILAAAMLTDAAIPDPPENPGITTIGSKKLGTAADCAGVVAFSATQGSVNEAKLVLSETLVDKGVGYAAQTGIFTTHCPGLYQFSFAGYGSTDLRLTLKRKLNKSESWRSIVSIGPGGGSNLVLLDVDAGDQLAIFVESGKVTDGATFTGHRVYKR